MSISLMSAAWKISGLKPTEKLVLLALADNASDSGHCWPSIGNIAERCDITERSVFTAIASLEKAGFVYREQRRGRSTVYRVNISGDGAGKAKTTPENISSPPLKPFQATPEKHSPTPENISPRTVKEPSREPAAAARARGEISDFSERIHREVGKEFADTAGRVARLIDDDCDFELDILPTVTAIAARDRAAEKRLPRKFEYYAEAIEDAKASRLAPLPEGKAKQGYSATTAHRYSPEAFDALCEKAARAVQ